MSHIYASAPTLRALPRSRASVTHVIYMSHVARNDESCHTSTQLRQLFAHYLHLACLLLVTWISHMLHKIGSHVTHLRKCTHSLRITSISHVCHTYTSALSHMWISHVSHMNQSCLTYELAMSRIWVRHVAHNNQSYFTFAQAHPLLAPHLHLACLSYIWIRHVSHMNQPYLTYKLTSNIWNSHVSKHESFRVSYMT